MWPKQNNSYYENITIDEYCVNDLSVYGEIDVRLIQVMISNKEPMTWPQVIRQKETELLTVHRVPMM